MMSGNSKASLQMCLNILRSASTCCFFLCCLEEDRGVELFLSVAFAVETGTTVSCGKDTEC